MHINIRPTTKEESWDFIEWIYNDYHKNLKAFGCDYKQFIPKHDKMIEMFKTPSLSKKDLIAYKSIFFNDIYNSKDLIGHHKKIDTETRPALLALIKKITKLEKSWDYKLADEYTILTGYGWGAGYNAALNSITLRTTKANPDFFTLNALHEFVHLCIEENIIQKYSVPQDLKERIVDNICIDYFSIKDKKQELEGNKFADSYITPETIEKDLSGAVKKMMRDWLNRHFL